MMRPFASLIPSACLMGALLCVESWNQRVHANDAAPAATLPDSATVLDPAKVEFFERKIRPVLVEKCLDCHAGAAEDVQAKLWLDSAAGWRRGGQSGPAIVPGKPEASLLLHALRGTEKDLSMPPDERLPAAVIADFETWIREGAIDPRQGRTAPAAASRTLTERERWAFSKPVKPPLPPVRNMAWIRQPLDQFLLAKLETQNLMPAPSATAEQLVRRLTYDLTGLPPTPAKVRAFVTAARENQQLAVEQLVDELLNRPAYGEKWGRYWLDCVRYADSLDARSAGGGDIFDAWRYRDWVIQSFNSDRPYDEFVRDQIAGDILASREWDADRVVATSVYAIGNWGNGDSDKQKVHTDIVDDQIDLTTRAFLGLTVACARCHDHKFDPITTADYYGLAGFFFSSHILERFAAPTAGESLMRIEILSPEEQARRNELNQQIAAIDNRLQQTLVPLTQRVDSPRGLTSGVSWTLPNIDNPSVVVNRSSQPQAFLTSQIPARSISVHPGPKQPVTVVWKSPVTGDVAIQISLQDIDGGCGDGIRWRLATPQQQLASGQVPNGGHAGPLEATASVQAGELIRLVIEPGGDYYCDSTTLTMSVQADGQTWSVTDSLLDDSTAQNASASPFLICAGDAAYFAETLPDREALSAELDRLKGQLPTERKSQGLQEGGIPGSKYAGFHDAAIHVRGSYHRLATVQPRGVPQIFQHDIGTLAGSGRLSLANWIASPENPLTARVLVNRIWQHHFGRGIVATPNNFGKLGTPPTHPDLLDWLAVTFMEQGWSIKQLHRLICTSAAYQQSSNGLAVTLEQDPDNLLFGRQIRRKLTAEELRDSLLAFAGTLDATPGGPAVADLTVPRRTLYLKTIRSDRATYQLLFDGADPTSIVEQRNNSLVAPQALWLLNRDFVLTQSRHLANRYLPGPGQEPDAALQQLVESVYGRSAAPEELQLLSQFLQQQGHSPRAWQQVCHLLLCSNEVMFVD